MEGSLPRGFVQGHACHLDLAVTLRFRWLEYNRRMSSNTRGKAVCVRRCHSSHRGGNAASENVPQSWLPAKRDLDFPDRAQGDMTDANTMSAYVKVSPMIYLLPSSSIFSSSNKAASARRSA